MQDEHSGLVSSIRAIYSGSVRINGGFFVMKRDIFRYIRDGEDLVEEPFARLIAERQLVGYLYHGFWQSMWEVWKQNDNAVELVSS